MYSPRSCILTSDRRDSRLSSDHFMHATLDVEAFDCRCNVTPCQHLNRLELGVSLTQNLIKLHRGHTCFLKLCEWASGLDAFMLANIAESSNTRSFL